MQLYTNGSTDDLLPGSTRRIVGLFTPLDAALPSYEAIIVNSIRQSAQPGSIAGTVFQDTNVNGVQDGGEPGMAGQSVFLDLNGSGALQSGDPTTTTDVNGDYTFTGLTPRIYTVRPVLLGGVLVDAPADNTVQVTVTSGANVAGRTSRRCQPASPCP